MRVTSFIYRIAAVFGLVFALAACSDEGPMEKAGKNWMRLRKKRKTPLKMVVKTLKRI